MVDWPSLINMGRQIASFTFIFNIGLAMFYFIFSLGLPPDHPLLNFLSLIGYIDYVKKLQQAGLIKVGEELTLGGLITQSAEAALAFISNLFSLSLWGAGIIMFRLLSLIPDIGPYLAAVFSPIIALLGMAGLAHFIICIVLKRC